ncbi:hypothetical protein cypCar_00040586 [Cyprinus carpio]|nr:hypothetical protein cypCar_00040586 [Cyprinus carpio]
MMVLKANVASQNHVLKIIIPLRFTAAQQTSLDHEYALRGKCTGFKLIIEKDTRGNRRGINIAVINGKYVKIGNFAVKKIAK